MDLSREERARLGQRAQHAADRGVAAVTQARALRHRAAQLIVSDTPPFALRAAVDAAANAQAQAAEACDEAARTMTQLADLLPAGMTTGEWIEAAPPHTSEDARAGPPYRGGRPRPAPR